MAVDSRTAMAGYDAYGYESFCGHAAAESENGTRLFCQGQQRLQLLAEVNRLKTLEEQARKQLEFWSNKASGIWSNKASDDEHSLEECLEEWMEVRLQEEAPSHGPFHHDDGHTTPPGPKSLCWAEVYNNTDPSLEKEEEEEAMETVHHCSSEEEDEGAPNHTLPATHLACRGRCEDATGWQPAQEVLVLNFTQGPTQGL